MKHLTTYLNLNADLQNAIMQDLECVEAYRKTGDKRYLYTANDWEKFIKQNQPKLLQLHEILVAELEREKMYAA